MWGWLGIVIQFSRPTTLWKFPLLKVYICICIIMCISISICICICICISCQGVSVRVAWHSDPILTADHFMEISPKRIFSLALSIQSTEVCHWMKTSDIFVGAMTQTTKSPIDWASHGHLVLTYWEKQIWSEVKLTPVVWMYYGGIVKANLVWLRLIQIYKLNLFSQIKPIISNVIPVT